ncbi:uncharacterized protein LOC143536246 [Bidens hawaiensis]|uniref:uncharacterized protein LOC143536246 n=1 Tax=Bidens hawaiensis TaxID=980011 RepID=UPI00404B65CB
MTGVEDLCHGCVRPIMGMSFYKCLYECDFVLHEVCTRLPNRLEGHTDKSRHYLYLLQEERRPNAFCRVCNHFCKGFFYSCSSCIYYTMDVSCALIIEKITHESHPGHPLSRAEKRLQKDYCRMCLSGFRSKEESSFICDICNFHLHRECALLFPETITHRYDKHLMTLSYSPIGNHEGAYFCEDCEEEINPYSSFYHCHECVQSVHSACAQLEPLPKSYNLYGLNKKSGVEYRTHQNKFHDHPLSFSKEDRSDGHCRVCFRGFSKDPHALSCSRCGFAMHASHLNEKVPVYHI